MDAADRDPGSSNGERLGFKGDTLWVNDPAQQRVTLLGREGEILSTFGVGTVTFDAEPGVFLTVTRCWRTIHSSTA